MINKFAKHVVVLSICFISLVNFAQQKNIDASSVVSYLIDHQKENGAFGPHNKEYTDLAWNYPALHTLKILGAEIPREKEAFENGNKSWIEINSRKNGPWYWSFFQKAHLYKLFNSTNVDFEIGVKRNQNWEIKFKPRKNYLEVRGYTKGHFFDIPSLWHMLGALYLLDGNVSNKEYVENYLIKRQAENGAFVDDVTDSPTSENAETNLIITSYAILTLKRLGKEIPNTEKCIAWLQSCQTNEGGFKYSPDSKETSNKADVWYTWSAIQALKALGAKPKNTKKCIIWLNSLENYDGGFGDRPKWKSRLYSTYYAVSSLNALTLNATTAITSKSRKQKTKIIPENKYSIFQSYQKSPSGGEGMIDSIVNMKINLIGVKSNIKTIDLNKGISSQVENNRRYAKQKGYPLEVLELPENYSHKLLWPNRQKADHVSNFIIPPNLSESEAQIYKIAYFAGQTGLTWKRFKSEVIRPIKKLKSSTLFYPELDYTMLNAYKVYDDGLGSGNGYNAVPGAHFGNIDWVRHFPYKERWEGVLPIIADGDAHGNVVKWRKNLLQFRNVFIAKDYNYKDYIDASLNDRSVCVIHMPSGAVRYYGGMEAIAYLKKHRKVWQWWEDE
ncbi:terpene cyclase/mutase family protein [Algibacter amylolyticus]|uniref:Geranylgeranyl transferase type II subunit beta n=1 Tax=Algibacter amylolyticus TaxID=1608400 RepID=A0A5M7B8Z5_9FLAO|nr:prenyltransferase/squalene oxidase repeat-containing protein [Algibacter amylolyticus]KAA5824798.1 terpene cyclase/mutase family protein [Algibacter amylolyticus]MBB5268916.1 prenyltransferase beta subunit [Algibacter amylolyticus]TSJ75963.1 terpene cyclase/mutase family protein [Algibacter amylolyticus]